MMSRQGAPDAMRSSEGNAEAALTNQGMTRLRDGRRGQTADRSAHSQEDPAIGRRRWSPLQMLHNRGRDFVGQRQFQGRRSLMLMDSQTALSPAKVIKCDSHHFAST